jgi:hypothetical protein
MTTKIWMRSATQRSIEEVLKGGLSPDATILGRNDCNYDTIRKQFAYYLGTEAEAKERMNPEFIVIPCNEADIQAIVNIARENEYSVVVRSGGHSYQGTSSTSGDKTIQIDMRNFLDLKIEEDAKLNTASNHSKGKTKDSYKVTVAPGILLKELYLSLDRYNCIIPMGICMNVAAGGHFQSSAFGMLQKALGYGLEKISHVKLVVATGDIVVASKDDHSELFWALRGGSPGAFGVVLEYQLDAINALDYIHITHSSTMMWEFSEEKYREALTTILRLTSSKEYKTKRNMMMALNVFPDPRNGYMLTSDDCCEKHIFTVSALWCGVDDGSIHTPIPDDLLEPSIQKGTTFYEFYLDPFKKIPGRQEDLSEEEFDREGANTSMARMVFATGLGFDMSGSQQKAFTDWKQLLYLARRDTASLVAKANERAAKNGIDMETEETRYTNSSHYTNHDFGHEAFVDTCVQKLLYIQKNPHVGAFFQVAFNGILRKNDYAGLDGGILRYDCWGLWRASAGDSVAKGMKEWVSYRSQGTTKITTSMGRRANVRVLGARCGGTVARCVHACDACGLAQMFSQFRQGQDHGL